MTEAESQYLTIGKLKAAIAELPDDMIVCIDDLEGAYWGSAAWTAEVNGYNGDPNSGLSKGDPVLFIS